MKFSRESLDERASFRREKFLKPPIVSRNIAFIIPIITTPDSELQKEIIPVGISTASPAFPPADGATFIPLQVDLNGALWVHAAVAGAGGTDLGVTGGPPGDGMANPTAALDTSAYNLVFNGVTWDRARSQANNVDAIAPSAIGLLASTNFLMGWNGASWNRVHVQTPGDAIPAPLSLATEAFRMAWTGANWDKVRTPKVFKTIIATAVGNTIVWTPTLNKFIRLMGYSIEITGQATQAVAGNLEITLNDAGVDIGIGHSAYVPAIALNQFGTAPIAAVQLGNGPLLGFNDVLNINLSVALATGEVRINVFGIEET